MNKQRKLHLSLFVIVTSLFLIIGIANSKSYSRKEFKHWSDLDHDGRNTREEILDTQSIGKDLWVCPYTGEIIRSKNQIEIDHVVSLKYAWNNGAEFWDDSKREQFANDTENLFAVNKYINNAKSDKSFLEWLPPNISFSDDFLFVWIKICEKYNLLYNKELLIKIKSTIDGMQKGIKVKEIDYDKDCGL